MKIRNHEIGLCSWSLQTSKPTALINACRAANVSCLQLDIGPYLEGADAVAVLREFAASGIELISGMIGFNGEDYSTIKAIRDTGGFLPDQLAEERCARAIAAAHHAQSQFGIKRLSAHAGFLPDSSSARYGVIMQRIAQVADAFAELEMELLFETGQEPAAHLLQFLNDLGRPNVGVNFDPANMILYGAGDPIAAAQMLGKRIMQVHIKDAVPSDSPGNVWGEEVSVGNGIVDWPPFLNVLDLIGYRGPLVIERESGTDRLTDIQFAITTLQRFQDKSEAAGL